jgi:hypothetical protein
MWTTLMLPNPSTKSSLQMFEGVGTPASCLIQKNVRVQETSRKQKMSTMVLLFSPEMTLENSNIRSLAVSISNHHIKCKIVRN